MSQIEAIQAEIATHKRIIAEQEAKLKELEAKRYTADDFVLQATVYVDNRQAYPSKLTQAFVPVRWYGGRDDIPTTYDRIISFDGITPRDRFTCYNPTGFGALYRDTKADKLVLVGFEPCDGNQHERYMDNHRTLKPAYAIKIPQMLADHYNQGGNA